MELFSRCSISYKVFGCTFSNLCYNQATNSVKVLSCFKHLCNENTFTNSRNFMTAIPNKKKMVFGKRCFPDHRGKINPSNRPDSDFLANDEDTDHMLDDSDYANLIHNAQGFSSGIVNQVGLEGNVYVILPWIKWGPKKKMVTTDELVLDEACALANSITDVNVVGREVVKVGQISKDTVFGPGQLDRIQENIRRIRNLSAVFVSVDVLQIDQLRNLEFAFGCRVVDRYWLVLCIFHQHAKTWEAKMQVSLAEIPYIRTRASQEHERKLLDNKVRRIQSQMNKLSKQRENIRKNRENNSFPSIAVVGYTNTGKTSLISCLSPNTKLEGENKLFATLDVTAHLAKLPWGVKAILLDTVGFIQDLPTALVASFNATLQDAANADVIVHVRDLSHPDILVQHATVMSALYNINLPPHTPIITLDNKVDLIDVETIQGRPQRKETEDEENTSNNEDEKEDIENKNAGVSYLSDNENIKKLYERKDDFSAVEDALADCYGEIDTLQKERIKLLKKTLQRSPQYCRVCKNKTRFANCSTCY